MGQKVLWNIGCFETCYCFGSLVLSVWIKSTFISQTQGTHSVGWGLPQPHEGHLPSLRAGLCLPDVVPQVSDLSV